MRARLGLIGIGVVALALLGACGSSSKSSSSSSTNTTAAASGETTTAASGGATLPGTGGGGTTVKVVVTDTKGLDGTMGMVVSPATAKAGNVTFTVTNNGTIDHEVVVLKLSSGENYNSLPTNYGGDPPAKVASGGDKVNEASNVGETGDPNLKPGQTRSFTVKDMTAGRYALVCNIAKHYGLGMRAPFVVTS